MRNYRVVTRYYGATDGGGEYITVRRDGGRVARIPYNYEYSGSGAHEYSVREAFDRWGMVTHGLGLLGEARGGRGNVYHVTAELKDGE
jgi:hypothetical protein